MQVQAALQHPIFQMACCDHILQLVCASICKNVFGCNRALPDEQIFKQFAEIWPSIDTSTYYSFT